MEGTGLLLSSLVQDFWQFVLVRCSLVIAGEALLGSLVINVTIAQWFLRKRGRAMGIANLGTGIAKLGIPLVAASLFILIGWRGTWAVFGIVAPLWWWRRRSSSCADDRRTWDFGPTVRRSAKHLK
jgi:nitrate/nitrite transporter NarK